MKHLALVLLLLACVCLCAAAVSAEQAAEILTPVDMSDFELNTEDGIYWAAITDTDRIEDSGFFTARLYLQDLYPADQVAALTAGSKVRVIGQVYTVTALTPHEEGTLELFVQEDFDGYIVLNKVSDFFYTALVNDWVPCTHIADIKILLPLANDFSFLWLDGGGDASVYDADAFIALLGDEELTQYNTMLQFSNELVTMITHTSYPAGPEAE